MAGAAGHLIWDAMSESGLVSRVTPVQTAMRNCTRDEGSPSGVTIASRYEAGVNRTYQDLAAHYGTTIMPTRPRKPRDKAKVEVAVQIAQRWVLARLRDRRFFSLAELNVAIRALVDELNIRLMRKL